MEPPALQLLLIEDDAVEADALRRLLTRTLPTGSSLLWATSLREGLSIVAAERIDAVLLDLGLPDSQGLETLERICAHTAQVAVVVLTGRDDEPLVEKALGCGVQEYLVKGEINAKGLARILRQAVERKRGELAMRQNTLLAAAVDNVTVGVIIVDARLYDWPIVFANPVFSVITGYPREEVVGRNCRFLQGPGTEPATVARIRAALGRREPFRGELRNYRKDGTAFWNEATISPVFDAAGSLTHFVGVTNDVTLRRRAEDARRESEARFHTLTDAVPQVIWTNEAGGKADYFNQRWFEYSGLSLEESVGPGWQAIVHPDDAPASRERWQRALEAGVIFDTEYRLRGADNNYRWFIGRNVPLKDAAGRVLGWFGSATDIHALKEAEQETRYAREEAEAANQAKDHFLAVLSHELRTPLTPVLMALHLLTRHKDLPPSAAGALAMIRRNVELEAHFIDELLDLTHLTRGRLDLTLAPTDLHEVIRRAVEVAGPDIQGKRQRLEITLDAPEHRLLGDCARLQQVCWNLLKNASKFTPDGGEIHLRTFNEPGGIVVEVTDTGIGMCANALEKVFQPFEQADNSIAQRFGGLGLGLAISKAAVDAHGGTIRAASAGPGTGATFTVGLPLLNAVGRDDDPPAL